MTIDFYRRLIIFVYPFRLVLVVINQNGGYEYVIAPLWKRFVAETLDVCLLFILKLVIIFMLLEIFEMDL